MKWKTTTKITNDGNDNDGTMKTDDDKLKKKKMKKNKIAKTTTSIFSLLLLYKISKMMK